MEQLIRKRYNLIIKEANTPHKKKETNTEYMVIL
jgi:hypothetical protein